MKEKYNSNVTLDGLNAAAMDLITDYIYTARVEITEENALHCFLHLITFRLIVSFGFYSPAVNQILMKVITNKGGLKSNVANAETISSVDTEHNGITFVSPPFLVLGC